MAQEIDLGNVDFITIGTIGAPGSRVFHLQAGSGDTLLTLTIEKEQAAAITTSINNVLEEIEKQHDRPTPEPTMAEYDMDLREPILPEFRIAQIGLAYDDDTDRMVLVMNELQTEDAIEQPALVRMGATRAQMMALAIHTRTVVASGRPTAQSNGHLKRNYD